MPDNKLYYGDNLDILRDRAYFPDACVDLIYLDPPFNSSRSYNVLFKDESGRQSDAQITAFEDTWHWGDTAERTLDDLVMNAPASVGTAIDAMRTIIGRNQMLAYLVMMTARLVELHRVLKPTGSLYLHCDPTASHYLKIILDTIFGAENFLNEITWKRTTAHNDPQRYGRIHDVILFYSKSQTKTFNRTHGGYSEEQLSRYKYEDINGKYRAENLTAPHFSETRTVEWRGTHPGANRQWRYSTEELERLYQEGRVLLRQDGTPRKDGLKEYLHEAKGSVLQDLWTDIQLAPTSAERLGYDTQKPLELLERIISASSSPGDVVLDPFCGCGTAIAAAQKLGRRWIGIDITFLSVALMQSRLLGMFDLKDGSDYEVVGVPVDLNGARALARLPDRYQFQWWALTLVKAMPLGGATSSASGSKQGKKGADKGIDGVIPFIDSVKGKRVRCEVLVQVKSGHVSSQLIRDLVGTVGREGAALGVFITLEAPTKPMHEEALSAGYYRSEGWNTDYPRIQILTVEELLHGKRVEMPQTRGGFKQAERVRGESAEQFELFGDEE